MKTIKQLVLIFILMAFPFSSQAQFFKKLKKRVEEQVEETVLDKTEEKAAKETEKSMDKIFNAKFDKNSPIPTNGERGNMEDVPESYDFDWKYNLVMIPKKKKDSLSMTYFLKEDAKYFGAKMENAMSMFMVFDGNLNSTIMFMDQDGNKMAMVNKMPDTEMDVDADTNTELEDYTIKKIDTKQILGFDCQGYLIENSEHKITSYITYDIPVSLGNVFSQNKQLPNGLKYDWLMQDGKQGLMLETHFEDKNKSKNNMKMKCTEIVEESYNIKKSDYKSF